MTDCPKCHGRMEQGFILDIGYGTRMPASWYGGQPARSIWTGTKTRGLATAQIVSWRCSRCGFLENYAPPA